MKRMIHFPKIRLAELVKEFGGANRADAIAGAQEELQAMRGQADAVIGASITALEAIAAAPESRTAYSPAQLYDILVRGDQVVTLAGTFGYARLDSAARSLCDLAEGLRQAKADTLTNMVPSVVVHTRTLRLLAPGTPALADADQAVVLEELAKILDHHGFARAGDNIDKNSLVS